jgi:nucleotide-binding universal stress UspA family protein
MSDAPALTLLLPVDGSPAALAAVHHAIALHRAGLALRCQLLNVQAPPTLYEVVVAHDREVLDQVRAAAGADLLAPAEALLAAAGIESTSEVLGGDAAAAIVDAASTGGADLVVMGAKGEGASDQGLGAVAEHVLRHAAVPVTVVHTAPAAED